MALTKYKLGDLIELTDERNRSSLYTLDDVKGISTEKKFIDTKANMDGVSLDSYKVVNPGEFTYVADTSRRGDKIALVYNESTKPVLISSIYTTFRICREDLIVPVYLFMFFNRPEFDRYARFNSWGSARETFDWEDFCEMKLSLPSIEKQRKYVNIYLALKENLATYQSKVDELKTICDAYIEKLKRQLVCEQIGKYIQEYDERNNNGALTIDSLVGISTEKKFIDTKADMNGVSLNSYKIVNNDDFAYVPDTSRRGEKMAIALNDSNKSLLISSIYTTFRSKNKNKLLPEYLFMFFCRKEFDRYARFNSWGSARETFTMDDMNDVKIPIPDIAIQREIVNIYKCYIERQRIAAQLKEQLNNICPVLIRGSLEEKPYK